MTLVEQWKALVAELEGFRANYLEKAKACEKDDPKRSLRRWGDAKLLEGKIMAYKEVIDALDPYDVLLLSKEQVILLRLLLGVDLEAVGFGEEEVKHFENIRSQIEVKDNEQS